jgi:hypothetical protein
VGIEGLIRGGLAVHENILYADRVQQKLRNQQQRAVPTDLPTTD